MKSTDFDIRAALVRQLLAEGMYRRDIRHELTLDSNSRGGRADVVLLLDNCICGIEIKSGSDTLSRAGIQFEQYRTAFDAMILVIDHKLAERNGDKALRWNDLIYRQAEPHFTAGKYPLHSLSSAVSQHKTLETSPIAMSRLLWADEIRRIAVALRMQIDTRHRAVTWLGEHASLKELRPLALKELRGRVYNKWESAFWKRYDAMQQDSLAAQGAAPRPA